MDENTAKSFVSFLDAVCVANEAANQKHYVTF